MKKTASAPEALKPPLDCNDSTDKILVWEGDAELNLSPSLSLARHIVKGTVKIHLHLFRYPTFRFEFVASSKAILPITDLQSWFEIPSSSDWDKAVMDCKSPINRIECQIDHMPASDGHIFVGTINAYEFVDSSINLEAAVEAKYLIINGPEPSGKAIQNKGAFFGGRWEASIEDHHDIVIDAIQPGKLDRDISYGYTHVVGINFKRSCSADQLNYVSGHLFNTLSLMKCRWVCLLGPWLYDSMGNLIHIHLAATKTIPNSYTDSWLPRIMNKKEESTFQKLYGSMFTSFSNKQIEPALVTILHWLIESEQCAGGVEGSLMLQQSALECFAWLWRSEQRKISKSKFDQLSACQKIHDALKYYHIDLAIPSHAQDLSNYFNSKKSDTKNLIDALVHFRNILVHAKPQKNLYLRNLPDGDRILTDLWYHIGGILQQAFLASIGYVGIFQDRTKSVWIGSSIKQTPWG